MLTLVLLKALAAMLFAPLVTLTLIILAKLRG